MVCLTAEQVEFYREQGYLILDNFLTDTEVNDLRDACKHLVDDLDPEEEKCIFTTTEYQHTRDKYFMESGDKIRYFFEAGAFDNEGNLIVEKHYALNKIGHALHWLEPTFKRITFSPKVQDVVRDIGFIDPAIAQSMYIFKQPGFGGEVTPHQDATFLHTEPIKIVGIWLALEDVTLDNGCLWFIPGSHKKGLSRRFVRNTKEESPYLSVYTAPPAEYKDEDFVPGPVPKGTCVLIHGEVVHKSKQNFSPNSRHIYTFHVIERQNTIYSKDNWLQPTEDLPFPGLFQK